ncbi:helix-turn-helix domain-containing protein [Streptomyces sp. NPDC049949]|uniref:helix-turn-helix domain-containing protein n=1 Tax=Streptomyces sp. NPDC049949 TaxID=3154627 RepID=UPI00342564D4
MPAATVKRAEHHPSRFTPERRWQFVDFLWSGMATKKAAAEVGITTATVYQRRRDPGFAEAMDRATASARAP